MDTKPLNPSFLRREMLDIVEKLKGIPVTSRNREEMQQQIDRLEMLATSPDVDQIGSRAQ